MSFMKAPPHNLQDLGDLLQKSLGRIPQHTFRGLYAFVLAEVKEHKQFVTCGFKVMPDLECVFYADQESPIFLKNHCFTGKSPQ